MDREMSSTQKIQNLLPGVLLIITEASRRDDIKIYSVDLDSEQGIRVFTGTAGSREHLSNILGLAKEVHANQFGAEFRHGEYAGIRISVYGKDY